MNYNQKLIHIRSQDCEKINNQSNNINIILTDPIACNEDEDIIIEPLSFSIPFSFYNINNINNWLDITEALLDGSSPQTFSIQISNGNYNAIQILSQVQTKINLGSPKSTVYTITYDKFTNKAVFTTATANRKITLLFNSGIHASTNLQEILGFSNNDFTFETNHPLQSDRTMNVSFYDSVYIHSNLGIVNQYSTQNKNLTQIFLKIPITSGPFSYIQFENSYNNIVFKSYFQRIQNINLSIRDYDGDLLDLNNNDWFATIRFETVPKQNPFKLNRDEQFYLLNNQDNI